MYLTFDLRPSILDSDLAGKIMQNEPPTISMDEPNQLIANRYKVGRSLGRGAFGQVFYAEDIKFDPPRTVALKLLHLEHLSDATVREDLKREASALARFTHPNILRVLDFDIGPDLAYIVTEFAAGGSLARKLQPDPAQPAQPMPLEEVEKYLAQLSDALEQAHAQGIIHRDIKPQNILLDNQGRPMLADFGLSAAVSGSSSSMLDITPSGTPLYMPPEQWQGQVSKASDIYSLGVVIYQLLTGQPPFRGNTAALAYQHLNVPIPPLAERAPWLKNYPGLDAVMAAAMAKDAGQRPKPASDLYRRFKAALQSSGSIPSFGLPAGWPTPSPVPPPYSPGWTGNTPSQPSNPNWNSVQSPTVAVPMSTARPDLPLSLAMQPAQKSSRGLLIGVGAGVLAVVVAVAALLLVVLAPGKTSINPTNVAVNPPVVTATATSAAITSVAEIPSGPTRTPAINNPPATIGVNNPPATIGIARPTPIPTTAAATTIAAPLGKVGQTVTVNNHALTVNAIERSDAFGRNGAVAGQEYISLDVTYQAGAELDLSSYLFFSGPMMKDNENYFYNFDKSLNSALSDNKKPRLDDGAGKMQPGDKKRGWLTFQIPKTAKGLVFEFDPRTSPSGFGAPLVIIRVALDDAPQGQSAPPPAAVGPNGKVGEVVNAGPYYLTVTKVETADEIFDSQNNINRRAAAGKQFISLEVIFESASDSEVFVHWTYATIRDSESFRYKNNTSSVKRPELKIVQPLPKGYKVRGWITFEVPKTAKGLVLDYNATVRGSYSMQVTLP